MCLAYKYMNCHMRRLTGGEGQVGEKVQGLTAVMGVAGVGEEKGRGGISMANKGGSGGPRDVVGVPVTEVPEGVGKVARELPHDDVVLGRG
jgi:hypothetical protein